MFIVAVIVLIVAEQFFIVGVLIAIWALITMIGVPLYKKLKFLFASPSISGRRVRAVTLTAGFAGLLLSFIFLAPFPYATRAEGVIWPPIYRTLSNMFSSNEIPAGLAGAWVFSLPSGGRPIPAPWTPHSQSPSYQLSAGTFEKIVDN